MVETIQWIDGAVVMISGDVAPDEGAIVQRACMHHCPVSHGHIRANDARQRVPRHVQNAAVFGKKLRERQRHRAGGNAG